MKNNSVAITRVIAMSLIITCHLCTWLGLSALALVFNVGVEIFILISGYLYANREIKDSLNFLKKRWQKICVPMYILFAILCIYHIVIAGDYSVIKTIPVYLLNLHGLSFLLYKVKIPTLPEMGQLWFLTAIMFCYIILVVIKKFDKENFWRKKHNNVFIIIGLCVIEIICVSLGIQAAYFLVFILGYILGKLNLQFNNVKYAFLSVLMICAMALRLICRSCIDGTLLYDFIIVSVTHCILALWIYITICMIYERKKGVWDKICESACFQWLEEHSMMIYMTHYLFLVGDFNVALLERNIIVQLVAFVIGTLISAAMLKSITGKLRMF